MCTLDGCSSDTDQRPLPPVSDLDRRQFLAGSGALALASVLAYPELAHAAADRTEDLVIQHGDNMDGITHVQGAVARPANGTGPGVLLIHEWWGLNDQIKAVAHDLAQLGYLVFAIDMYDGDVGTTPEEAMSLMRALDPAKATEKVVSAVAWLRENGSGPVGTMGWCFGGGWSLNTSIATPVDATVIYYGNVTKSATDLASLQGPVLGHFGTLDQRINMEMVSGFEAAMAEAGKTDLTVHWYDADHAFANPTGARYDAEDAATSWKRTTAFLEEHLI